MTKRAALIFLLILAMPCAARAQTFGAQEATLDNGLQIVVIPNHRAPVVTSMLWMKVGAADEQPGLSGMAHYLEHLMFKGTAKQKPGEFSKLVKTLGGNDNAFTSQDYTAFYESIAVENLPRVLEMEADRLVNLNPPPEHYASEKQVVIEERRQRTDNDPRALFQEQLNSAVFINHPYGTPVIGWMAEIEKYEWADVKKFYDAWYAPNNAVLVVSGDITMEQLKPMAEKYFGAIARKELPPRKRPQIPPAKAQSYLRLQDPAIHQSIVMKIYPAPSESTNRKDSLALQVLSEILSGGPTARFYKHIVVNAKKATGVDFNYNETALDYGTISIGGTPADGVTPEELGAVLDAEIKKVIAGGVTNDEVKEAVQRLQDEAVFARDSLAGPAMIFGAALTTGGTVKDVEDWAKDIATVTVADVKAAAAKYLDDEKPWLRAPVSGYLLPATKEATNVQR
ncbi:MAG: hypothetical protein DI551_07550 [Micavibrio aeruginosavorus]|uniref:Insulinase family protein n=1 Tax=Micavibrio aeruginosavorus TaxID=349221 RepID=A0A2W5N3L4_9BACT|nr:MAG: hypothetical protein DI551_07550 [Micavibrio aeruginosavorus]